MSFLTGLWVGATVGVLIMAVFSLSKHEAR
jgi:hypothetical protein